MPPHCDTMDGPVVTAARRALDAEDVKLILPYVRESGERELKTAFEKALRARKADPAAREVADLFFFETAVRIHRTGEGATYTGLKPAGLDEGPVIPVAEKAIETGSPEALIKILTDTLRKEVQRRFERLQHLKGYAPSDVRQARAYVEAMLGLEVYSHKLYMAMKSRSARGLARASPRLRLATCRVVRRSIRAPRGDQYDQVRRNAGSPACSDHLSGGLRAQARSLLRDRRDGAPGGGTAYAAATSSSQAFSSSP